MEKLTPQIYFDKESNIEKSVHTIFWNAEKKLDKKLLLEKNPQYQTAQLGFIYPDNNTKEYDQELSLIFRNPFSNPPKTKKVVVITDKLGNKKILDIK